MLTSLMVYVPPVLSEVLLQTESRAVGFTTSRMLVFQGDGGGDGTDRGKNVATGLWDMSLCDTRDASWYSWQCFDQLQGCVHLTADSW